MSKIIFTGKSHFINNTSSGFGGALSARSFAQISVQGNLSFINNNGYEGGAVFVVSSKIEFADQHVATCNI